MVDVQPTNAKLRRRAVRIVEIATGLPTPDAALLLARCKEETKTAIVAALAGVPPEEARAPAGPGGRRGTQGAGARAAMSRAARQADPHPAPRFRFTWALTAAAPRYGR